MVMIIQTPPPTAPPPHASPPRPPGALSPTSAPPSLHHEGTTTTDDGAPPTTAPARPLSSTGSATESAPTHLPGAHAHAHAPSTTSYRTTATSPPPSRPTPEHTAARAALTSSLSAVGGSISNEMQWRAASIHANAATLARQQAEVQKDGAALGKHNAALHKIADEGAAKIKEIGDVQNWAELLERDLLVLEETLRIVDGGTGGRAEDGEGGKEEVNVDVDVDVDWSNGRGDA
ncbi:MAG: hypothetical protein M1838_000765 [Thelocarpon superellum]|nr:MAG: hypothetical protein M1838_000765 [Thelocarpon superellum]